MQMGIHPLNPKAPVNQIKSLAVGKTPSTDSSTDKRQPASVSNKSDFVFAHGSDFLDLCSGPPTTIPDEPDLSISLN